MNKLQIEYRKLRDLKPYENNPRDNEAAVSAVAASLKRFGFRSPVVIDQNDCIVCGHTRYLAAGMLGMTEVPCVKLEHLTDDQVKAFRLADNKVAERSRWDDDLLFEELSAIEMDMTVFGFEQQDVKEDNFSEPPPKKPISQRGDIWLLGRHRLMCGDSTDARDVQTLMDGKLADLLLTDPPYNVNYEGGDGQKIMNDSMPDERFRAFLIDAFASANDALKPGAVCYIWHADSEGFNFRAACDAVGWPVKRCLVWVKNAPVLGRQDYLWKHEPCLLCVKPGAEPLWVSDGTPLSTILRYAKPAKNADHPTMKPVLLFDKLIQTNTRQEDIVLDVFGGSGTCIAACEQNGRTGYSMELDPHYADVIVSRYIRLVGNDQDVFLLRNGQKYRRDTLEHDEE